MYPFSVGLIRDRYLGSYLTSNYSIYLVVVSIREREITRLKAKAATFTLEYCGY